MLSGLALEMRRLIFDRAMNECAIPLKSDLVRGTGASAEAVDAAVQELADAHMIVLQPESGEVLMANPFSAVPTAFVVNIGSRNWYGNCVWDAMGIAAIMGTDAELNSSCGCCGSAMHLSVPRDCRDDDERVAHFAIPAARWWDDIVFN